MTLYEKQIIKAIRPRLDRGLRGWDMVVYQNLTTKRRGVALCRCGCGRHVRRRKATFKSPNLFFSQMCFQVWKRNAKKVAAITCLFLAILVNSYGANLFVFWTNGPNGPSVTQTIVQYGMASGSCTNAIGFVIVPISQTNVWITNLLGGQRYWVTAIHSDGTDVSACSNEGNAKTPVNPPNNLGASK